MKRETYQRGVPGAKWGIWNCSRKEFQFDICEDTPMLAVARLFQKIGDDARQWRFEPRQLPHTVNVRNLECATGKHEKEPEI